MCDCEYLDGVEFSATTSDPAQMRAWLDALDILSAIVEADNDMRRIVKHCDGRPPDLALDHEWETPADGVAYARSILAARIEEVVSKGVW